MKQSFFSLIITFVSILFAATTFAGQSYAVECKNDECTFDTQVNFGGGILFEQITGYCVKCEKFVYLRWTREGKKVKNPEPKPNSVGRIWIPSKGEVRKLYACPHCDRPFLPIRSVEELKHCPKCGEARLTKEREAVYD